MKIKRDICIYHGNCLDGFSAAWVVHQKYGDSLDYFAGSYNKPPPDVTGKHVIMVDFSYKAPIIREMQKQAKSIIILDHHETAKKELAEFDSFPLPILAELKPRGCVVHFDMSYSGAVLAWKYCFPGKIIPRFLLHIQDRDLWQFKMPSTKEINAVAFQREFTFENWSTLKEACITDKSREPLIVEGGIILKTIDSQIDKLLAMPYRTVKIQEYTVSAVNVPKYLCSELLNRLAVGRLFAASYVDTATHRLWDLRSAKDGINVEEIAAKYGGGGHMHAAGFSTDHNWFGDDVQAVNKIESDDND